VPAFTLTHIDSTGNKIHYVGAAPIIIPTQAKNKITQLAQTGQLISVKYTAIAEDAIIAGTAQTGHFNILYTVSTSITYLTGTTTTTQAYSTIMIIHGTYNLTSHTVNTTAYLLDLTTSNNITLTKAGVTSTYEQKTATHRKHIAYHIGLTLINSTDNTILYDIEPYDDELLLIIYNDIILIINSYRTYDYRPALHDIIKYNDTLVYSFYTYYNGSLFLSILSNISTLYYINLYYLRDIIRNNYSMYMSTTDIGLSLLPIITVDDNDGNYIVSSHGILVLLYIDAIDSVNYDDYLIIIPYYIGNNTSNSIINDNIPDIYKMLYNNGSAWRLNLDKLGGAYKVRIIMSWHISGFIYDNIRLYNDTTIVPIMSSVMRSRGSYYVDYSFSDYLMRSNVSVEVLENLTFEDVAVVVDSIPVRRNGEVYVYEYVMGGSQAVSFDGLPVTWLSVSVGNISVVGFGVDLYFEYIDDYIYDMVSWRIIPSPPNVYYSVYFNCIGGVPVLGVGVNSSSPVYVVSGIDVAPDFGFGALYSMGVSLSVVNVGVAAQFHAVSLDVSDIAVPLFAPGGLVFSRQGFMFDGIMVVGAIDYVYLDSYIEDYTFYDENVCGQISGDTGGGTIISSQSDDSLIDSLDNYLGGLFVVANAQEQYDVVNPPACLKLGSMPGSVVVVPNALAGLDRVFIYDAVGNALKITVYYFDTVGNELIPYVVCDGNCSEVQASDPCRVIQVPASNPSLSPSNVLVAVVVDTPYEAPPEEGAVEEAPVIGVDFPVDNTVSAPSFDTPSGLLTVALFIAFYVFYNQRMSHGQALAVAAALSGVASILFWGDKYVEAIIIVFGLGLALYYVLNK